MRDEQLLIKSLLSDEALSTEGAAATRKAPKPEATPVATTEMPPIAKNVKRPTPVTPTKSTVPLKHHPFHPVRMLVKIILFPIFRPLVRAQSGILNQKKSFRVWSWIVFGNVATRLMLAPIFLAMFFVYLVYTTTHPATVLATNTPSYVGLSYKRVNVQTGDKVWLSAWLVPALTADELTVNPVHSLLRKHPAALLCHGLGATHDQYLTLASRLHVAGFTVLLLDTRGQGTSDPAPVTFGLREHLDLLAGVTFLRSLQEVDPARIAIVGHDMAATAALQTAAMDGTIAAVVADGLPPSFGTRTEKIFAHPFGDTGPSVTWLAPLYTTAFEMSFRDDVTPLDPDTLIPSLRNRPLLCVARRGELYTPMRDLLHLTEGDPTHVVILPSELPRNKTIEEAITEFLGTALPAPQN